jgi:hypothetical protein
MAHSEVSLFQSKDFDLSTFLCKENIEKNDLCCQSDVYRISVEINIDRVGIEILGKAPDIQGTSRRH